MTGSVKPTILLFASGKGSLLPELIKLKKNWNLVLVADRDCMALEKAKNEWHMPGFKVSRKEFQNLSTPKEVTKFFLENLNLNPAQVELVVLAGFLSILPKSLIHLFPNRIINSHPALLPQYGGKGMYGNNVHQQVLANKETHSGCSVHFVTEEIDQGEVLAQARVKISPQDSVDSLSQKIIEEEKILLPAIVKSLLRIYTA